MKIKYEKEILQDIVLNSETLRQVLLAFNRNESASSYRLLNKKLNEWSINTDHFLSKSEITKKLQSEGKLNKLDYDKLFCHNSHCGRGSVKKRIMDDNLIEYKCFKCGNIGEWMGDKLVLILDHINGVNNDNRLNNLRFACPNCNSTLDTHCQGSKVYNINNSKNKIDKRTIRFDRLENRKLIWPNKKELIELLASNSFVGIGKIYGVSDNAVRKWCKKYEII
jgi:5-methylcytosine-specific restriction endonuclease McrA